MGSWTSCGRGLLLNFAESLEDPAHTFLVNVENDIDDPARVAAYLEGRLTASEREAYLVWLAANPRRSADLASAVALLGAIEAKPKTVPSELLARAHSVFARRAVHDHRPGLARRNHVVGWSLAALMLLVFVPSALVLVGGQVDWPFHSATQLRSLDASPLPPLAGTPQQFPRRFPTPYPQRLTYRPNRSLRTLADPCLSCVLVKPRLRQRPSHAPPDGMPKMPWVPRLRCFARRSVPMREKRATLGESIRKTVRQPLVRGTPIITPALPSTR